MERGVAGHRDDREQIAAEPVHLGLDHAQDRVGANRGVDRVAAAFEHLHARARRQRLAGGDDAVPRGDGRSARDNVHGSRKYYTR